MKRVLLIGLVLAAVGIYSYNAFLLFRPAATSKPLVEKRDEDLSVAKLLARSQPVRFIKNDRDPFQPHPRKDEIVARSTRTAKTASQVPSVSAPAITINGIMWDPQSPLAMITLPDGTSAAVKVGQTVGEITIKKIEKQRISVIFKGKTFRIDR